MKSVKAMSTLPYNSLMLVLLTFVLVEAKPDMTYTVDEGDSRPVTSHQNLTACSGVYVELSVCVPTARPGSLLSLKAKGQTTSTSQTCVRVAERFSSSQTVIFSYDEEEFVFNVKVDVCVSRKRRSSTWRSRSPARSWIKGGYMPWANSGQSTSRLRHSPPMTLDQSSYMTCAKSLSRQPDVLSNGIRILCDTVTDGGNWIVIQRRTNEDVDFYRDWPQYVNGFGDVTRDHWLGLENIHTLCPPTRPCRLRVDLKDPQYNNGQVVWAEYSNFSLSGYSDNYRLSISGYDAGSTAGNGFNDGLSYHLHNGMAFTTKDKDNELQSSYNCAIKYHGGWWYNSCFTSNLNGMYGVREEKGMKWYTSVSNTGSLYATYTEMKIRVLG